MTWEQLQRITLQKLFATAAGEILQDDSTKDYLGAMPAAANEGMLLLAMRGHACERMADITAEVQGKGINLGALLPGFIEMSGGVFKLCNNENVPIGGWSCKGGILYLPKGAKGQYTVSYKGMPTMLCRDTPPDAQIELSAAASVLLPLYIASQLYKDDDIALSGAYRNEFEAGAEEIRGINTQQQAQFISTSGWWV